MRRPLGVTASRYIMDSQRLHPEATGELSGLLNELIVTAKTIAAEVNMAGLAGMLGMSAKVNGQGEEVQKLDEFANRTIIKRMARSGYLCVMTSEEEEGIIPVHEGYTGKYTLTFDPLNGSSNMDVNVSIGTIFAIHRRLSKGEQGNKADLLQYGRSQVVAGYILYGSSTMLVMTSGDGVQGFTLDPSIGEFYLSHADIRTPRQVKYLSVNQGNRPYWREVICEFIDSLGVIDVAKGRPYSSRYIGSLVADFHRNLLTGGLFVYPRDSRDRAQPHGKLRLLYEAAPLAMLIEEAGGRAITDDGRNILDIEPESLDHRVSLIIGSKEDVDDAEEFLS